MSTKDNLKLARDLNKVYDCIFDTFNVKCKQDVDKINEY